MFSKSKLLFWVAVTATIVAVCVTGKFTAQFSSIITGLSIIVELIKLQYNVSGKDDDDVSDRIFGLFDLQTSMAEDDFEDVMKEMGNMQNIRRDKR